MKFILNKEIFESKFKDENLDKIIGSAYIDTLKSKEYKTLIDDYKLTEKSNDKQKASFVIVLETDIPLQQS